MDKETQDLLIEADAEDCWEHPPGFDWQSSVARVRRLKPEIEAIVGRELTLDDRAQDASFFADLCLYTKPSPDRVIYTVFGLRFSCFGDLFTTLANATESLAPEVVSEAIACARRHGFKYAPPEALAEPYTGTGVDWKTDWWNRYFDYI